MRQASHRDARLGRVAPAYVAGLATNRPCHLGAALSLMPSAHSAHLRPGPSPSPRGERGTWSLDSYGPGCPARRRWQVWTGPHGIRIVPHSAAPGANLRSHAETATAPHGAPSGHCVKPRPPRTAQRRTEMEPPPRHRQIRPFRRVNCRRRPRFHLAPPAPRKGWLRHHGRCDARTAHPTHTLPQAGPQHGRTGISPISPTSTPASANSNWSGATCPAANKPTHSAPPHHTYSTLTSVSGAWATPPTRHQRVNLRTSGPAPPPRVNPAQAGPPAPAQHAEPTPPVEIPSAEIPPGRNPADRNQPRAERRSPAAGRTAARQPQASPGVGSLEAAPTARGTP